MKEKVSVSAQNFIARILDSNQDNQMISDDKKAHEVILEYRREDDEPEEEAKLYGQGQTQIKNKMFAMKNKEHDD